LAKLGRAAEPGMRKALSDAPSIELRRRPQDLLAPMERERRRTLRAVEILELNATPQAKTLLERLSGDDTDPELARTARSALLRMTR
jgi:hypothetical protein